MIHYSKLLAVSLTLSLLQAGLTHTASASFYQDDADKSASALSVEFAQVEVETLNETLNRLSSVLGESKVLISEKVTVSTSVKANGVKVTVNEPLISIFAYGVKEGRFFKYDVPMYQAGEYVLTGEPGLYLFIVTTPTQQVFRDFEILPRGPPIDPPIVSSPLEKICRDALAMVNDPGKAEMASRMAILYELEANSIDSGRYSTFQEMMASISEGNRAILGDSRVSWQSWREALNTGLLALKSEGKLETVKDHAVHWRGIARGLK